VGKVGYPRSEKETQIRCFELVSNKIQSMRNAPNIQHIRIHNFESAHSSCIDTSTISHDSNQIARFNTECNIKQTEYLSSYLFCIQAFLPEVDTDKTLMDFPGLNIP